ncbi:hypothetical protein [Ohtaekwangia sp.]|uniref:hypothetical protein n=1 Tax=Ohtaekwangia sp. TaxID=2066019 RepID=UPI002FDD5DDB
MKYALPLYMLVMFTCVATRMHAQEPCCNRADCKAAIDAYIISLKRLLNDFGTLPSGIDERKAALENYKTQYRVGYAQLRAIILKIQKISAGDRTWLDCFSQRFIEVDPSVADEDCISWYAYLSTVLLPSEFTSPEFAKGFGVHLDLSQGVADPGKSTEAYALAGRVLLSYTFCKHGHASGGRWRVMAGPSIYYQDTKAYLLANPRVEFRLKDIGNKLASIGNIKLIADGNIGDVYIVGGGVGLELYKFGVQVLYQRQSEVRSAQLLTGLFYRFQKK